MDARGLLGRGDEYLFFEESAIHIAGDVHELREDVNPVLGVLRSTDGAGLAGFGVLKKCAPLIDNVEGRHESAFTNS